MIENAPIVVFSPIDALFDTRAVGWILLFISVTFECYFDEFDRKGSALASIKLSALLNHCQCFIDVE